jgi:TonB family protein
MAFIQQKINYYFNNCEHSFNCSPVVLSFLVHFFIILAIFGFFSLNNTAQNIEFAPLTIMSSQEFKELNNNKKIYANKLEQKNILSKNSANSSSADISNKDNLENNSQNINSEQLSNSYVNLIANELERRKSRFSMALAPDNVKTAVIFKVKLDQEGNLQSFKISKNSGYDFFDKLAEKILTCKKSFPIPPKEIASMGLEISIPIIFDIYI